MYRIKQDFSSLTFAEFNIYYKLQFYRQSTGMNWSTYPPTEKNSWRSGKNDYEFITIHRSYGETENCKQSNTEKPETSPTSGATTIQSTSTTTVANIYFPTIDTTGNKNIYEIFAEGYYFIYRRA